MAGGCCDVDLYRISNDINRDGYVRPMLCEVTHEPHEPPHDNTHEPRGHFTVNDSGRLQFSRIEMSAEYRFACRRNSASAPSR